VAARVTVAAPGPAGSPGVESSSASGQAATPTTLSAATAKEDEQWIQSDDYFVALHAYEKSWLTVRLGKMKEPPKGADGEAQRGRCACETRSKRRWG